MQTAKAKGGSRHIVTEHQVLPRSTASDLENCSLLYHSSSAASLVDCLPHFAATVIDCEIELQEAERCLCPACPVPCGRADATAYVRRCGGESWPSKDTK